MPALRAPWSSPRRLAGAGGLLLLVTFLAACVAAAGMAVLRRAAAEQSLVPLEARYYVVARSALADAAGEGIAALPGVRVVGDRSLDQLVGAPAAPPAATERLRVVEAAVALPVVTGDLDAVVEAMGGVDGVVDVIDVNAAERASRTPERAHRWLVAGIALVAIGAAAFVLGVARAASLAVAETRDEIEVRVFLGAEPRRLWMPLGASLGIAACGGVAAAFAAISAALRWIAPVVGDPVVRLPGLVADALAPWAVTLGALAVLATATAVAALTARRAVARLASDRRASGATRAFAALAGLLLAAAPALAGAAELAHDPAGDAASLQHVDRELAISRRALHQAQRSLVLSEHLGLRAVAAGDPVRARLAAVRAREDALQVDRWRASRDALASLRRELREQRRAERAPGPPIDPRLRPVAGGLELGFNQNGGRRGLRGFRNGIALRTRPGETIRATAAGRVAFAGELAGAGPVVVVSHGRRTYSVYGRVAEVLVARGMHVEPGEPIARAPEEPALLYFAVRERGRATDPIDWLQDGKPREGASG